MGSGSTVAAAEAVGARCVGVERFADYSEMSEAAIPQLAAIPVRRISQSVVESQDGADEGADEQEAASSDRRDDGAAEQMTLPLPESSPR